MDELMCFLEKSKIKISDWEASGCEWGNLISIREDYLASRGMLEKAASLYVGIISGMPTVHSVRFRVKDADHLIEKIIRKSAEGSEKYRNLSTENYHRVVTDLVGIRALHLFKDDCFEVADSLSSIWQPVETPIAYIRSGDPDDLTKKYVDCGMEVKTHSKGYRSLHFIFSTRPIGREVFFEVQVRTVFEEGWSEIDHTVRYPNFSDNELVGYFLAIFNRLAGSADEMGGFVKNLAFSLREHQNQIESVVSERDASLGRIDDLIAQLEQYKQQDQELRDAVANLKLEVSKVRSEKTLADWIVGTKALIDMASDNKERSIKRSQNNLAMQYLDALKYDSDSDS